MTTDMCGESIELRTSLEDLETVGSILVEQQFKSVSVNLVSGLLILPTTSITEPAHMVT